MRSSYWSSVVCSSDLVAGAGRDPDVEAHLRDRRQQVALNVDGKRLQRRDVEGVEALGRSFDHFDQAGKESRESLARPRGGDQQRVAAGSGGGEHFELVPPRAPPARSAERRVGQAGVSTGRIRGAPYNA